MKEVFGLRVLLAAAMGLLCQSGDAQTIKLDSLERAFSAAFSPVEKAGVLKAYFNEVQHSDPSRAVEVAKEIDLINRLAGLDNGAEKLEASNRIGIAFMNLGQDDSALFYFQRTIELSMEQHDSAFLSKSYNNIGVLNGNQGNYSATAFYFNKSAEIDAAIGDAEGSVIGFINVGLLYSLLDEPDSARIFLDKALKVAEGTDRFDLMAASYLNIGTVEHKGLNYDMARHYYFKAIDAAILQSDNGTAAKGYRNLAKLYQDMKKYEIAIEYDRKGLEYALKGDALSDVIQAHLGLSISYERLGRFREAHENHKEYTALMDTLTARENRQVFIEMQEKFRSEQTQRENQILVQQNRIQDLEIANNTKELAKSRIIIVSSILGLVLLLILALMLYNRNVLKQRANLRLQEANDIIVEKNRDIMASLEYASKIQEALLPTRDHHHLFTDSFYLLQPRDVVSGDFFWYAELDGKMIVAVVDCTGHGVPGAFMSMIGNTFLHQIVNEKRISMPGDILDELRTRVIRALNQKGDGSNRKDGMDMVVCTIDPEAKTLTFAGANNPIYLVQRGIITELKGDKQPVGYFSGQEIPFSNRTLKIEEGDCIYLFSDGYADQFGGPKGKKFKYKQLRDLLFANHQKPMKDQKRILEEEFEAWKGNLEQVDDVCVVGLRI